VGDGTGAGAAPVEISRLCGGVECTLRGAVQGDGPDATAECHGSAMYVASISE